MKLLKLDLTNLARSLLGHPPSKSAGDTAFVKIVVQLTRFAK